MSFDSQELLGVVNWIIVIVFLAFIPVAYTRSRTRGVATVVAMFCAVEAVDRATVGTLRLLDGSGQLVATGSTYLLLPRVCVLVVLLAVFVVSIRQPQGREVESRIETLEERQEEDLEISREIRNELKGEDNDAG